MRFRWEATLPALLAFGLCGCGDQPLPPVGKGGGTCLDPNKLAFPTGDYSLHAPGKVTARSASMPLVTWMPTDSVQAFFGTRNVKLVLSQEKKLYLVSWETGNPDVLELSQGDEMPDLTSGDISSPLFSPDGNWITFAAGQGAQGFIEDIRNPLQPSWRVPLSIEAAQGYVTADPHWVTRNGRPWIYFANTEEPVKYIGTCGQFEGHTYRLAMMNDSTLDSLQTTGLPGAFRGGLSRDGVWAGTAYSPAGLFNTSDSLPPILISSPHQKCNPSMNPFPAGSLNSDFLMLLGFGGPAEQYRTPVDTLMEGVHENLWIHDQDDLILWRGKLPDSSHYYWEKPEWSAHPRFATAVAARKGEELVPLHCDLYAVKIPDLSNARRDTLYQAEGYFQLGKGAFGDGTYTHLWVGP